MRAARLGVLPLIALAITISASSPRGRIEEHKISGRKIWIYLPPDYTGPRKPPYDLLVCFDGLDYQSDIPLPSTLESLAGEGKVAPMIAVMVDTSEHRLEDLANHRKFADFVGKELMPWVRRSYPVTSDPGRTILAGYSAGGLAAAYVAFHYPSLFGNVLSQSGAFWRGNEGGTSDWEWLTHQFAAHSRLPLRFYLEVGAEETRRALGTGPVFLEANRRLRDVLQAKGYPLTYVEVPGAQHEPRHWAAQLAPALVSLASGWPPLK